MPYPRIERPTKEGVADSHQALSWRQRRFLAVLGLPAFGMALAYTAVTTYVPVLIERLSGPAATGVIIGAEGLFAMLVPVIVGAWSDGTNSGLGRRLPFVLAGATLACVGLLLVALTGSSLTGISVALAFFFVGYFIYHSAYYALFPDLVSDDERGRSQGFQGAFRAVGLLLALTAGGLLLGWWQPLPFLVGMLAIAGVPTLLVVGVRPRVGNGDGRGTTRSTWTAGWELVRHDRDIRGWFVANSLWEARRAAARARRAADLLRHPGLRRGVRGGGCLAAGEHPAAALDPGLTRRPQSSRLSARDAQE